MTKNFNVYFLLILLSVMLISCQKEATSFTHSIVNTEGIIDASMIYPLEPGETVSSANTSNHINQPITVGDITFNRVAEGSYQLAVVEESETTLFSDIPSQYLNLNSSIEITRNVFQDYFPDNWEALKGAQYTALYIKDKSEKETYYIKVVATGTDKEIGMRSEGFESTFE